MQDAICPPALTRMRMSFNADRSMAGSHHINLLQRYHDHGCMRSLNPSSTDSHTSSSSNHSHSSTQDHAELSTTGASTASSSSCCGGGASAAGALPNDLEEGHGESRCCDQSSAMSSSKSITHDDVAHAFGSEYQPCKRSGSATAASAIHHRSSCFGKDVGQEQEYFQQILGSSSYGWTDEKHSSYLDSMEADFLRSVMFRGNVLREEDCSSELSDSATSQQAKSSKVFKVCQHGSWRRPAKGVDASNKVCPMITQVVVAVKNPWIKRFSRSPVKRPKVSPSDFRYAQHPLLHEAMNSRKR